MRSSFLRAPARHLLGGWLFAGLAILAVGCSGPSDKKTDLGSRDARPPLEVPPGLTAPETSADLSVIDTTTYSDYARAGQSGQAEIKPVLPRPAQVRIERADAQRWLVIERTPEQLWPALREFLLKSGFSIAVENPQIGILETDWEKGRVDAQGNAAQRQLGKAPPKLNATGTRDKFRIRLERGVTPGMTEVYLTHRGMVEVTTEAKKSVWQPRPADPESEAELLNRLVLALDAELPKADSTTPAAKARWDASGAGLTVLDDLGRAWRRVGLALDRAGFTIEDRDRAKGLYYVRYNDVQTNGTKRGVFSRWFGGTAQPAAERPAYQVRLERAGEATTVRVLDTNGAALSVEVAHRLLDALYQQFK